MNGFLAAITLSETQIAAGVLAGIVTLIGYHKVVAGYIREQAGVKETQTMEITGQPIRTAKDVRMATHEEVQAVKQDVDQLREEVRGDVKGIHSHFTARFEQLNQDRRTSIAGLHAKLDNHEREDAKRTAMIMERIGQLTGRPKP